MAVAEAPYLAVDGGTERYPLSKNDLTIGRAPESDIHLNENNISRYHAQLIRQGSITLLSDLGSSNGTFVNGVRIHGTVELHNGDKVSFAGIQMTFHTPAGFVAPQVPQQVQYGPGPGPAPASGLTSAQAVPEAALEASDGEPILLVKPETMVGRVPGNDLVVNDTYVSREHAKLQNVNGQFIVADLGSSNGTFVNEQRVYGAQPLQPGDRVRFGRTTFIFRRLTGPMPSAAVAAFPVQQLAPSSGLVTVQVENVHKVYRSGDGSEVPVLRGVSMQIRQGEFVALVGPSGSGKSTLINMMTGIDYPDTGSVQMHGQNLGSLNENSLARWRGNTVGLIFQFFQLLPTLSALENVMLPMDFCNKWASNERKDRAMQCLALVGMDRFADRLPANMSGGQQQRVAIARALANDPPIIIGDEPTGNLDSATAQQIFSLLGQLAQSGKTVAFVTHDPLLARSTPRKIEILDGQVVDTTGVGDGAPMAHA